MKLQIALEAETIARLRAEWELTAQKQLAPNLRNLLNNFVQNQRALELQINSVEEGVEDEPGSSSLGEELNLPETDFNSLTFSEEFAATKPNPSPHHKLRPSVKNKEVGLPEHDVTDVTSLHSLEVGFDSAKPTPAAPNSKPCCQEAEPIVISQSATELVHLQGKISILKK